MWAAVSPPLDRPVPPRVPRRYPRSNFLAYNLTTGELVDSFAPSFNAQVRAVAVSPDQKTLYVGGQFTAVDGVNRYRIVAFDLATGTVKTAFAVSLNSTVYDIAATATSVFVTGIFTLANGADRVGAAALDASTGAVRPFAVNPTGGTVRNVVVSPDGSKAVLGGAFTTMNGSANPGYGLAMVDARTGANLPLPANGLLRNGTSKASIMSLTSTVEGFYGTGYSYSRAYGNVEGAFRINWDGTLNWVEDCHGDTYSLAISSGAVYVAGHPHYCGGVGAFPQTQPWGFHRALAFTTDATQVLGTDPHSYYNYGGKPGPSQLNWYPDIAPGEYTGQGQGPWSVAASDDYVVYGGEFPTVNGKPQQGLVRFAKASLAPNADGPRLGGAETGLAVRAYGSALRVVWPANWDRDNEDLSYRLFRNDKLVYETSADSTFYRRPNLSYLDRDVSADQVYSYRLKTTDPFGNSMWSSPVTGSPGSGSTLSAYQTLVLSDGAQTYWTLDSRSGTAMPDLAGSNPASRGTGVTPNVAGAIVNDTGRAFRLAGSSAASTMVNSVAGVAPDNFHHRGLVQDHVVPGWSDHRLRQRLSGRQLLRRPSHLPH